MTDTKYIHDPATGGLEKYTIEKTPERIYVDGIHEGVGTCFEDKPSCVTTEYIRRDVAYPVTPKEARKALEAMNNFNRLSVKSRRTIRDVLEAASK